MNNHNYVALDPGFTTGYAAFDENGELKDFGQITEPDAFMDWLEGLQPHPALVVMEDYIIRKGISHSGSRAPTIQLIGMIKRHAKNHGIKLVLQQAHAKAMGYKFAGLPQAKSHSKSHQWDAIAHGVYYLQKIGVREPRVTA